MNQFIALSGHLPGPHTELFDDLGVTASIVELPMQISANYHLLIHKQSSYADELPEFYRVIQEMSKEGIKGGGKADRMRHRSLIKSFKLTKLSTEVEHFIVKGKKKINDRKDKDLSRAQVEAETLQHLAVLWFVG
jgi:hypothetical protein